MQPLGTGTGPAANHVNPASAPAALGTVHMPWQPGGAMGSGSASAWMPPTCELVTARLKWLADAAPDAHIRRELAKLVEPVVTGGSSACRMLEGDLDLDGRRDGADLTAWIEASAAGDWLVADLDRDGRIDGTDLGLLLLGQVAR